MNTLITPELLFNLTKLLQFILGLAFLIVVHEFGHFLASRLFGVEVEEFGLGFPPRITRLFRAGGTDFTLNWIPLGGFVRPKGENDPDVPGGLAAANPWVRLGVLAAGPLMNLAAGLVFGIIAVYTLGQPILNIVRIEEVADQSPAQAAGLQVGDVIREVNGVTIDTSEKVINLTAENVGKPMNLLIQRGQQAPFSVTLTPRENPPANQGRLGVVLGHPYQPIPLSQAAVPGIQTAIDDGRNFLMTPVMVMQRQVPAQDVRFVGYKGMFDIFRQVDNPWRFFTFVSIILGLVNLLPIPALDGGRILLTLPEIILRRRIPPQYENTIHLVGFALLLVLIIYINIQDFINPIALPK